MKITNGAKCTNDKIKDENNGVSATSAERFLCRISQFENHSHHKYNRRQSILKLVFLVFAF